MNILWTLSHADMQYHLQKTIPKNTKMVELKNIHAKSAIEKIVHPLSLNKKGQK
jgi:hypothetical protein